MENKKLAIKGHSTRGKEVLEILEMLGGNNKFFLDGTEELLYYYIGLDNNIYTGDDLTNIIIFSLEEFLEKYPFKVGDKVIVKGLPEYPKSINFMKWFDDNIHYSFDNETWFIPSALQPYKEESMEERKYSELRMNLDDNDKLATEAIVCGNKILPPKGYLIGKITLVDNGMLIEFVKIQYPKTFDECCKLLSLNEDSKLYTKGYKASLIQDFQTLLICRDAYWKIAGKEMGLEKTLES